MDAAFDRLVPPIHKRPVRELPPWLAVLTMAGNTLRGWPDAIFDVPFKRSTLFGQDTWILNDPADARRVLVEAPHLYERPPPFRRPLRPVAGDGVLLAEGMAWRRKRLRLAPVFSPARIARLLPHFQLASDEMVRSLKGRAVVKLDEVFHDATLDAVLRALFSLPSPERRAKIAKIAGAYTKGAGRPGISDALAQREDAVDFKGGARRAMQTAWRAEVGQIITERRAAMDQPSHDDLLDLLIAARDKETEDALSDEEICDEAGTLLAAGFETTSRLLGWASLLLADDPAEPARVMAEIDRFQPDRIQTLDDLLHWPRLKMVILEALRLYPPVAFVVRDAIAEHEIRGNRIMPGARVWISPWIIHRHRSYWQAPDAFMPERFENQASPWTSGGPFIPFGLGPRICIGAAFAMAEAQILLASLLKAYSISRLDQRPVLPMGGITTMPSYQARFRIEVR